LYKEKIADSAYSGFSSSDPLTNNGSNYLQPNSLRQTEEMRQCSGQGIYVLTDGEPNQSSVSIASSLMGRALDNTNFNCDGSLLSEVNNPTYGTDGAWSCIGKFSQSLLDATSNPSSLTIKTAVVGFGSAFNSVSSYDKSLSQDQNLQNVNNANLSGNSLANDIKNAARWGIIGEGGWYSGNESQDVVNSVNDFISSLSTEIPSVTTGSPTIPADALNPSVLQNNAYFPQFQPTPEKPTQLWLGNLKKYLVHSSGKLVGKSGASIFDDRGAIKKDVSDYWTSDATSSGGVLEQLKLRSNTTAPDIASRKLLTNRTFNTTTSAFESGTNLQRVNLDYLTQAGTKDDPYRGYLMSLLGYKLSESQLNNPSTISNLGAVEELRQLGAVMHSSPVLLTTEGEIKFIDNKLDTTQRKDFVLFGTTQGLLHVVDAKTGDEKFAFVPNEMLESQKEAFSIPELSNGGLSKLYYGVDGPWTAYTEYAVNSTGKLVVGKGAYSQEGKLNVYGGLRMGGRSYYALDLQDMNNPKLKFHINPDAATSGPLSYMGQSWSKPRLAWVNWKGKRTQVMFVGGGYDAGGVDGNAKDAAGLKGIYTGYENDEYVQNNKRGAGVYMFDADDGELLWWASANAGSSSSASTDSGVIRTHHDDLKYSVVSEIRTVDRDSDGLTDHLYFGDLGGQVFRIDLDNKTKTLGAFAKSPVRLLDLTVTGGKKTRFYDMPAFSLYKSKTGDTFAVVSIGSGNRSSPLAEYTNGSGYSEDAIFNIYDKDVANRDLYKTGYSYTTRNIRKNDLGLITESDRKNDSDLKAPYTSSNGWYYPFQSFKVQSEKVYGTPVAMKSVLHVSTFDGSKPGISGDCGAGVKGESFVTRFCLPYGQCEPSKFGNDWFSKDNQGPGIHTIAVIGGGTGGG
ncbi:pilus assembly protein, partial [Acinetobacter sp. UBA3025]